jgi:hypothetical protein
VFEAAKMKSGDTAAPPNVNYDSINMGSSAQLNTTESVIVNNGRSDSQVSISFPYTIG